MIFAIKNIV